MPLIIIPVIANPLFFLGRKSAMMARSKPMDATTNPSPYEQSEMSATIERINETIPRSLIAFLRYSGNSFSLIFVGIANWSVAFMPFFKTL